MSRVADHLIIAPVVLPLLASAVMLLIGERQRGLKAAIGAASTFTLVGIAIALLVSRAREIHHVASTTPG